MEEMVGLLFGLGIDKGLKLWPMEETVGLFFGLGLERFEIVKMMEETVGLLFGLGIKNVGNCDRNGNWFAFFWFAFPPLLGIVRFPPSVGIARLINNLKDEKISSNFGFELYFYGRVCCYLWGGEEMQCSDQKLEIHWSFIISTWRCWPNAVPTQVPSAGLILARYFGQSLIYCEWTCFPGRVSVKSLLFKSLLLNEAC